MILAKQVQVRMDEAPKGWSLEGIDFVNKVIAFIIYTCLAHTEEAPEPLGVQWAIGGEGASLAQGCAMG